MALGATNHETWAATFIPKQKQNRVPLFKIIEQSKKRQRAKIAMELLLAEALRCYYEKLPHTARWIIKRHIAENSTQHVS